MKTGGLTTNAKTDLDGFMYRHVFGRSSYDCLYVNDVKKQDMQRRITTYNGPDITNKGFAKLTQTSTDLAMTQIPNNYHTPYASRYTGGFDLLDSFKIPRPCAFKSFNLTS